MPATTKVRDWSGVLLGVISMITTIFVSVYTTERANKAAEATVKAEKASATVENKVDIQTVKTFYELVSPRLDQLSIEVALLRSKLNSAGGEQEDGEDYGILPGEDPCPQSQVSPGTGIVVPDPPNPGTATPGTAAPSPGSATPEPKPQLFAPMPPFEQLLQQQTILIPPPPKLELK